MTPFSSGATSEITERALAVIDDLLALHPYLEIEWASPHEYERHRLMMSEARQIREDARREAILR